MAKMKKAIFGIGVGKEERQYRRAQRQSMREERRNIRQSSSNMRGCNRGRCGINKIEFKSGGVAKAQPGKTISFTTPRMKNKVTVDTTGYSAGKKRFPMKAESTVAKKSPYKSGPGVKPGYGTMGRKSATRAIEYSQGKPYKKMGSSPIGAGKAKKALSKSGSKISKKK